MRTLLIAPSFLAVFVVTIFSVGWLITTGGQNMQEATVMPSRASYTGWFEMMRAHRHARDSNAAERHEFIEELGQY